MLGDSFVEKNFQALKASNGAPYGIRHTKSGAFCYWCDSAGSDMITPHERRRDDLKEMLAVFDRDEAYVKRLSGILNRRSDCPFEVRILSEREDLKKLSSEGRIKILLLGEGAEEKEFDRSLADRTVRLNPLREDQGSDDAQIYKYQPAAGILRSLLSKSEVREESPAGKQSGKVPAEGFIGVASPVGRCGKTSFARTLAKLLGEEKKVLSFDLEAFSNLGGSSEKTFRYGLSDLLYAERVGLSVWEEEGEEPERFIEKQWGLDMAVPADSPEVIFETPPGEIIRALEKLFTTKAYQCAVLDLGTEYRLIREFLPKLGKLYVPTLADSQSQAKTAAFIAWVRKNSMKKELPVEAVLLPAVNPSIQADDPVEALLFGEMGAFVRKLMSGESSGDVRDGYGQK